MNSPQPVPVADFLKRQGLLKASQKKIDRELMEALGSDRAEGFLGITRRRSMELGSVRELYALPKGGNEAALLFSSDHARYLVNLAFLGNYLAEARPRSVVEFGSGDGLTLEFVRASLPNTRILGIEREANLADIAAKERGIRTLYRDYRSMSDIAPEAADLVLCNFGFDLDDLAPSERPHEVRTLARRDICQSCAEDYSAQIVTYVREWTRWSEPAGEPVVAGRIPNVTLGWAFNAAAASCGWRLDLNRSAIVKTRTSPPERLPHLVFRRAAPVGERECIDEIDLLRWED